MEEVRLPRDKEESSSYKDFWPTGVYGKLIGDLCRSSFVSSFDPRSTIGTRVFPRERMSPSVVLALILDQDARKQSIDYACLATSAVKRTSVLCVMRQQLPISLDLSCTSLRLLLLYLPPPSPLPLSLSFSSSFFSQVCFFCFLLVLFDRLARLLFIETTYRSMFYRIRRLVRLVRLLSVFSPA